MISRVDRALVLEGGRGAFTLRARVRVPSTSKRQIVFAMGRLSSGGYVAAMVGGLQR